MAFGDVTPACTSYASGSTKTIVEAVEGARKDRLADVDEFVSKRYGPQQVAASKAVHQLEEGRPIDSRWTWWWRLPPVPSR